MNNAEIINNIREIYRTSPEHKLRTLIDLAVPETVFKNLGTAKPFLGLKFP